MTWLLPALSALPLAAVGFLLAGRHSSAKRHRIRTVAGVQRAGFLPIGGIPQYVQIRGQDAANPVLLVLHGGPGSPLSDTAYHWQMALEQEYTVVHWDQRGCGNTYARTPSAPPPTMERLLADLDQLTDCLRLTFHQDKVYLIGHSWGAFLGGLYAGRHPEKVAAWIAVSPMVDFRESERHSTLEAARLAAEAGKDKDARMLEVELGRLLACADFGKREALRLLRLRQRKERYLPPQFGGPSLSPLLLSPYLTWGGLCWRFRLGALLKQNGALYQALFGGRYTLPARYEVPVLLVAGDRDWTTPYPATQAYFRTISAPKKGFLTISDAGHLPFAERPAAFSQALLQALRKQKVSC